MKRIVYSPVALSRLSDIADYTWDRFGEAQAEAYLRRLSERVELLAEGSGAKARPCDLLMEGVRDAEGLIYCREGSHFLILRDRLDALEVVEIFHERMDIGRHLSALLKQPPVDFDGQTR